MFWPPFTNNGLQKSEKNHEKTSIKSETENDKMKSFMRQWKCKDKRLGFEFGRRSAQIGAYFDKMGHENQAKWISAAWVVFFSSSFTEIDFRKKVKQK